MQTINVEWTGIRPMLMHNGLMADPTNDLTRKIKAITSKGSKKLTDTDHENRNKLEWQAGLYWSAELNAIAIPSDNIEATILGGARKNKLGKDFQAALFCNEAEVEVKHKKSGKSMDQLYDDKSYQLRKGVKVQQARIIRIRPMVPTGWKMTFNIEFDDEIVNRSQVIKAMEEAGALVGLGDWRPKFGRFEVKVNE